MVAPALLLKDVRTVSCGNGFTVATVATEWIAMAALCMRCSAGFGLLSRRHHCRHCGGVFCHSCSKTRLPLLRLGYIEPVRVCDGCVPRVSSLHVT